MWFDLLYDNNKLSYKCYITPLAVKEITQDSGLRTGLFNIKLHNEILHQDYIAKQY